MTRNVLPWTGVPATGQACHDIHWRDQVQGQMRAIASRHGTVLPFGLGRSYGDVCCAESAQVISGPGLDRIIAFDVQRGVIKAEAGLSLAALHSFAVPRGWCLQVVPGTGFVTLGGAVANDVHGKNHHRRGTFGSHVLSLGLVRSDRGDVTCSASEETALFSATIGGLGLTGFITWVELQLMPVASAFLDASSRKFGSLEEFIALSRELDSRHEYGVAWVDCTASGSALGRGVYSSASHASAGGLTPGRSWTLTVPFNTRVSMVNGLTMRAFNQAKWWLTPSAPMRSIEPLGRFFHPLDGIHHWNRLYGSKGFQQFQCVLPEAEAERGIRALLTDVTRSGLASFLTVLKRCGDAGSPGLMSFPMAGMSLAIDFPVSRDLVERLLPRLDAIVRDCKGRLYPAKDAHMSGEDFRTSYPAWKDVEALRDPCILSRFWARVTR